MGDFHGTHIPKCSTGAINQKPPLEDGQIIPHPTPDLNGRTCRSPEGVVFPYDILSWILTFQKDLKWV